VTGSVNRVFVRSDVNACDVSNGTIANSVCWVTAQDGTAVSDFSSGGTTVNIVGVDAIAHGGCGVYVFEPYGSGTTQVNIENTITSTTSSCGIGAGSGGGFGTATLTVDHSRFTSAVADDSSSTITTNSTDISDPPQFADGAHGDFREVPGSPTVDAGLTSASVGSTDLSERPREQGKAVDMGAYEEISGPTIGKLRIVKRTKSSIKASVAVNPDGLATTVRLIATRPSYAIVLDGQRVGAGRKSKRVTLTIPDLRRHTKYVIQAAGSNAAGTHTSKKVAAKTR
jgi:hypothetical protein